jgi:VIT1/CCC1 family predicted Fe2+/Mn2+ transporter
VRESLRTGISFGLTSGVITTLGLMVGLYSGSHSKPVVLGGILTIAIADAFSDAVGIHISEESKQGSSEKHVWVATASTFLSKFLFALTFVVPVLLFDLYMAILVSVVWGFSVLGVLSYKIAASQGSGPWKVVAEHLFIALIVITITHFVGGWIGMVCS